MILSGPESIVFIIHYNKCAILDDSTLVQLTLTLTLTLMLMLSLFIQPKDCHLIWQLI